MDVFGRFRRRTRHLPVGGSSWERTSTPSDTSLPEQGKRRHLPQVPYLLPKDVLETQRLDFQFYLIRSILHGNHASPLRSDVASILDVGCGTGRWVTEMARRRWDSTSSLLSQGRYLRPMPALSRRTCSTACPLPIAALTSPTSGSWCWPSRQRTGPRWSENWCA